MVAVLVRVHLGNRTNIIYIHTHTHTHIGASQVVVLVKNPPANAGEK